jgi:hypothetical protein
MRSRLTVSSNLSLSNNVILRSVVNWIIRTARVQGEKLNLFSPDIYHFIYRGLSEDLMFKYRVCIREEIEPLHV